jgi:hypothetical protein
MNVCSNRGTVKTVTKSKAVLPRVCGTRFLNNSGGDMVCDKNNRFWRVSIGKGFVQQSL